MQVRVVETVSQAADAEIRKGMQQLLRKLEAKKKASFQDPQLQKHLLCLITDDQEVARQVLLVYKNIGVTTLLVSSKLSDPGRFADHWLDWKEVLGPGALSKPPVGLAPRSGPAAPAAAAAPAREPASGVAAEPPAREQASGPAAEPPAPSYRGSGQAAAAESAWVSAPAAGPATPAKRKRPRRPIPAAEGPGVVGPYWSESNPFRGMVHTSALPAELCKPVEPAMAAARAWLEGVSERRAAVELRALAGPENYWSDPWKDEEEAEQQAQLLAVIMNQYLEPSMRLYHKVAMSLRSYSCF